MLYIGVIGGHDPSTDSDNIAYQVGKEIAAMGAVLVCGGLGGVMESAAKGAKDAGGTTIGILPGTDRNDANPYIDIAIVTGLGYARNFLVVENSDILVACEGKYGTLSEIAYGLQMKKKIIGINTWDIEGVISVRDVKKAFEKIKKICGRCE